MKYLMAWTFPLLVALAYGCAVNTTQQAASWRAERSIANSSLPSMPPDSERSRWVTRMER